MAAARQKLLDTALSVIRTKGYEATTIDELCTKAGVAKGSFFHHFRTRTQLRSRLPNIGRTGGSFVREGALSPATKIRSTGFSPTSIFARRSLRAACPDFTCLVGTMVQEVYETSPAIRAACDASVSGHAATVEADITEAIERHGIRADWTAPSLALHTQAVIQGAFILAKAKGDAARAGESIDHLRRYIELLFRRRTGKGPKA